MVALVAVLLPDECLIRYSVCSFCCSQVSQPPLFFKETNPQPRKHTLWQATSDFTGGQATTCKSVNLLELLIDGIFVFAEHLGERFYDIAICP